MKALLNLEHPPLQNWNHPVFTAQQLRVDVLRLDQLHPILGGNKWMKLRGFLQQALQEGKTGILTKGGPWSNHVQAAAWACKRSGLSFSVWIKGHAGLQTAMLNDVQAWNGAIRFINRSLFYDEAAATVFAEESNLLYIPMGGADERGIVESSRFLQELHLPYYDSAICAVGTATTFGGLAFVPDNFPTVIGMDAGINDHIVADRIARWQQSLPQKKLELYTGDSWSGFAKQTPELVAFANELYRTHQIPTDIVYTTKLFHSILQLAETAHLQPHSSLLILHSGGLQGNRSLPTNTLEF